MAGSISYRSYTADDGVSYAIKIDKSNASATVSGGTGALCPVRTANLPTLPRGLRPRYALAFCTTAPNIKRKFYIGTTANYIACAAVGATISAVDYPGVGGAAGTTALFTITAIRGENRNKIPDFAALDSGLTDGSTAP